MVVNASPQASKYQSSQPKDSSLPNRLKYGFGIKTRKQLKYAQQEHAFEIPPFYKRAAIKERKELEYARQEQAFEIHPSYKKAAIKERYNKRMSQLISIREQYNALLVDATPEMKDEILQNIDNIDSTMKSFSGKKVQYNPKDVSELGEFIEECISFYPTLKNKRKVTTLLEQMYALEDKVSAYLTTNPDSVEIITQLDQHIRILTPLTTDIDELMRSMHIVQSSEDIYQRCLTQFNSFYSPPRPSRRVSVASTRRPRSSPPLGTKIGGTRKRKNKKVGSPPF
jgi:hypothetical protein